MTVGRMQVLCWTMFVIMSVAFLPLAALALVLPVPHVVQVTLAVGVIVFWWAWFAYAMYLTMAVEKGGDKRLLRRGIRGTAEVLTAGPTNEVIQTGQFAWEAPRVWRYRLRVHVPNREPYETVTRTIADRFVVGQTVDVAVAPHNHKRVAIDAGQASDDASTVGVGSPFSFSPPEILKLGAEVAGGGGPAPRGGADAGRLSDLERLGDLHAKGVLSDDEFAREKARILGQA
jgi:hypothetical protein